MELIAYRKKGNEERLMKKEKWVHIFLNIGRKHCKKWVTEKAEQNDHKVHHQKSIQKSTRMENLRRH